MIEVLNGHSEFEEKPYRERERKYLPIFPDKLEKFRIDARPIEQFYLSHPTEDFNLRFRESLHANDTLHYEATLKDRGKITHEGLDRLEVTAAISPETYRLYKTNDTPVVRKLRSEANANVSIDFLDDGRIVAESEHPMAWTAFLDEHKFGNDFVEITGDRTADNEWSAHLNYRRKHNGREAIVVQPELSVKMITLEILNASMKSNTVVVQIAGRSGSGKSTVVSQLRNALDDYNLSSICLSTDDYHRGKKWLDNHNDGEEWTDWDAPIVYDTATLVEDIRALQESRSIVQRTIDFNMCEPAFGGVIAPAPIIFVEGIYAKSPEISQLTNLVYELPTPLATCIGRRLLRDMRERPKFANPETSLKYMLENAEPAYRSQSSVC